MIFGPDNKDVIIFPEKANGNYYALHRPTVRSAGKPEIWIAESDNLLYWGNHKHLAGLREGMWDSGRIGGGVVFSCGALAGGDTVRMYYGAADTSMACAELSVREILDSLQVIE